MKLTLYSFLSLDGVMQAPGGPDEDRQGGFPHGGWLVPFADDDFVRLVIDWTLAADAFLLGRKTYEIFAASWPRVTDPADVIAERLNSRPKYVASRTLDRVDWQGSSLIEGDVTTEVAKLKQMPGGELQVHGSGNLAQTLIANNLVDHYRLYVFPVVLRTGKRLFPEGGPPGALKHLGTQITGRGVVVSDYEPAGALTYGTFEVEDNTDAVRNLRGA
jgi:dihydrofolate reductase